MRLALSLGIFVGAIIVNLSFSEMRLCLAAQIFIIFALETPVMNKIGSLPSTSCT